MQFKELYQKSLQRKVNPAVSASDMDDETINIEIEEYVFTKEIVENLIKILDNIHQNRGSHTGIWINGYYGSGKSHFLKYVDFCLMPKYAHRALARLKEAAPQFLDALAIEDLIGDGSFNNLLIWLETKAQAETIMFNIGAVHNANAKQDTVFTQVFWNEFNAMRGYNKVNLAMAQYLEAPLDELGKFDAFKQEIAKAGYNWERDVQRFCMFNLDTALDIAKKVEPSLSYDVIREAIKKNDVNVSVESFAKELKRYVDSKNSKDFRLIFFIDEISQFVDGRTAVILQLQETVDYVMKECQSQVWFACTAQEEISSVVQSCNIASTSENFGKILGRFEVRASLQSTSPEFITQRRILEKKAEVEMDLHKLFEQKRSQIDAQFQLPTLYNSYSDKQNFADFYPFVPYQFPLIMNVLDNFLRKGYLDKQVRGDERSLINITFSIAKETAEDEVGDFIPFDRFFGAMLQGSMQHIGRNAIKNGRKAVESIADAKKQKFASRVVDVMFMICNMSEVDKNGFAANIDNITTLLMTKIDQSKAAIKSDVAEVLDYLEAEKVIRKSKSESGTEFYEFFTEEETEVAKEIELKKVDSNTYADELRKIYFAHFDNPSNSVNYATSSFKVGASIEGRNFLSNNADIYVDFVTSAENPDVNQFAAQNKGNHLVFFLYQQLQDNQVLMENFLHYCRVQKFQQENSGVSEERRKITALFVQRARDIYERDIKPAFGNILDTCPVIAGPYVLDSTVLGTAKKKERYTKALSSHLKNLYSCAELVCYSEIPKTSQELSTKILRKMDATTIELPLTDAEQKVFTAISRKPHDVSVYEIIQDFKSVPYGWSEVATAYVVNELVRRHKFTFSYNNDPNVSRETIAAKLLRESTRFMIEPGKAISQQVINDFLAAWKQIFNVVSVKGSNDSTELYRACNEEPKSDLNCLVANYEALLLKIVNYPFADSIKEAIKLMKEWKQIREHAKFFTTITEAKDSAEALFDRCKDINLFCGDQLENYKAILDFITDNEYNFSFLPDDMADAVSKIKGIVDDKEPFDTMPQYKKLKDKLAASLKEARNALVADIKAKYNAVFDSLEQYAASVNVARSAFADREATISIKCTGNNFYALQNAADTTDFFKEQMDKINKAIPAPAPVVVDDDKDKKKQPAIRKRTVVKLDTAITEPLKSEEDVNTYLATLKLQLMKHLDNGEDIIVS